MKADCFLVSGVFCCLRACETGLCSTLVCFLSGDRWGRSAPAEKRDDDEISGAEAGACTEAQLPHRQTQTEPAVILGPRPSPLQPCFCRVRLTEGALFLVDIRQASGFLHFRCITGRKGSRLMSVCHWARSQRSTSVHQSTKNHPGALKGTSDSLQMEQFTLHLC